MSCTYEQFASFAGRVNLILGGERMSLDQMVRKISELKAEKDYYTEWDSLSRDVKNLAAYAGIDISDCESPNEVVALVLAQMKKRLMPDGYEWPRFEDGELVRSGDKAMTPTSRAVNRVDVITFTRDGVTLGWGCGSRIDDRSYGNTFKRPPTLDADGAEIHKGDIVCAAPGVVDAGWAILYTVIGVHDGCVDLICDGESGPPLLHVSGERLTHKLPVLAKDGKPIEVCQTLYGEDGKAWHTCALHPGKRCGVESDSTSEIRADGTVRHKRLKAEWLTHEKPEPADTWERIEDDCTRDPRSWCAERMCGAAQMDDSECAEAWAKDLVRRAKKLAGVSE